jgi:hypothetical protein
VSQSPPRTGDVICRTTRNKRSSSPQVPRAACAPVTTRPRPMAASNVRALLSSRNVARRQCAHFAAVRTGDHPARAAFWTGACSPGRAPATPRPRRHVHWSCGEYVGSVAEGHWSCRLWQLPCLRRQSSALRLQLRDSPSVTCSLPLFSCARRYYHLRMAQRWNVECVNVGEFVH